MPRRRAALGAGIAVAPKGVLPDAPGTIAPFLPAVRTWAVLTEAAPPNNASCMEAEEWRESGRQPEP